MKHGWEYKKFTDVCDVQYGFAFDSKFFTDDENAMPLIRIRDVMRGYSETFYNGEIPNGYLINEGDYLVGMDGEFNIGRWGKRPGLLNQRVCKMSSSSKLLDNQYMYYFMKVCLKSIEDETPFVTVKHLSAKRINLIKIPLPPLLTQQSIASELDKINELIRLKKEQLKDYDNLVQSIFYEMFGDPVVNEKGWEVKKFADLYKLKSGDSLSAKNFVEGEIPVYGGNGISGYHNDFNMDGDFIIIGRVGVYCGNVREVHGKFWLTDNAFQLFYSREIQSPCFIHYLLEILDLHKYANAAAQPVISNLTLKDVEIIIPPLSLQQLFAKRIELIEQQKAEIQTTIADLETLLASRMQYWFD